MFQRDYLMRMIEQITEALGEVMQLRKERKQEEGLELLDDMLERQFGLSGKLIRSLSDDDLLKLMSANGVVQVDNLQAIAVTFKEQAELHEELGHEDESYELNVKALQLFMRLTLLGAPASIVNPADEARKLMDKLGEYELPVYMKRLQTEWHESEGEYDQAENLMYELLDDGHIEKEEMASFYRRLLLYEDGRLEEGGLPRNEIQSGLADLGLARKE